MVDHLTAEKRSENMSRIRSVGNKPESRVRSILHRLGFRFRKNVKNLPGKPDIVLKKHSAVIFVHGCFWHRHNGCPRSNVPKSRAEYWVPKLDGNKARDKIHRRKLRKADWNVLVIWECELQNLEKLERKLLRFLSNG